MRFKFLILFYFLISLNAYSQKQAYNWYFGNNAGISFKPDGNAANPLIDGQVVSPEGCCSISDSTGSLLYYSDGQTVWDKNHNILPNGSGLKGSNQATQSSVIIPNQGDANIYYIFTINTGANASLSYSTIDRRLNNGNGDITTKNSLLNTPVSQKIAAITNGNGVDFWVVAHGWLNNTFYSYRITSSGINPTPVQSNIGSTHQGNQTNAAGYMRISADGTLIALALPDDDKVELFNFNNQNGLVSNYITIPITGYKPYGIEFSPDASKLYVSCESALFQFELKPYSQSAIPNSRVSISTGINLFYALQLGPDGKIYIAQNNSGYLSRINSPNENGSACGYQPNTTSLSVKNSFKGLPNIIQSYMTRIYVNSIINVCEGDSVFLTCTTSGYTPTAIFQWSGPKNFSSYLQNPVIPKAQYTGYYKVNVSIGNMKFSDSTLVVINTKLPVKITTNSSNIFCEGDSIVLYSNFKSNKYNLKWSTGESSDSIIVRSTDKYYLIVEQEGCKSIDSISVFSVPKFIPSVTPLGLPVLCDGDSLILDAKPKGAGIKYIWSTGDTTSKIIITKGDIYSVIIDKDGCLQTASINISRQIKPITKITASGTIVFCIGDSVQLYAEPFDPDNSYLWSTGETSQSIWVKSSGMYKLETVAKNGCLAFDSLEVKAGSGLSVKIIPVSPKPYCDINSLKLIATPSGKQFKYLWSTGETSDTLIVNSSGKYFVNVNYTGGCSGNDTIGIQFSKKPKVKILGDNPVFLCKGETIRLTAQADTNSILFLWSGGDTTSEITVYNEGDYFVKAFNKEGCSDSAFVKVINYALPIVNIEIEKKNILCSGDSINLTAKTDSIGYDFLWSTNEKTDKINIKKTGQYYVTVKNSRGCFSSDTVNIIFNPQPELKIISDKGFNICDGDTAYLETDSDYFKYLWSNGETTRTIKASKSGDYTVTVFDTNGCSLSSTITLNVGKINLNKPNNVDYSYADINNPVNQNINIINNESDDVEIGKIFIKNNTSVFKLGNITQKIISKFGGFIQLSLDFNPDNAVSYNDSLIIEILKPCPANVVIGIKGTGRGRTLLSLPDTIGIIGTRNFRIPVKVKMTLGDKQIVSLSYKGEIKFYQDVFLPELLTNGIIRKDSIDSEYRILTIQDDNVIITSNESVITELVGTVLLGEHNQTPLRLLNFEWNNPNIINDTLQGNLFATGVCGQDLSRIVFSNRTLFQIAPNPVNTDIFITIINPEKSIYTFSLYSANGNIVKKCLFQKSDNGKSDIDYKIDVSGISDGVYYLVIINNDIVDARRVIVLK